MRDKITPIQSKQLLDSVASELKNMNEQYYLIFNLILETGIPLECISLLKVSDIKNNPISFTPSHKFVSRSEYLSPSLTKNLKTFAGDRNDDELAFYALKDPSKPFPTRNFQKALIRASEFLSLERPISVLALRKTYILNVFLKENNYNKIYALTECRSVKGVLEYLNLEVPEPDNKYLSGYTIKDALVKEKTASKVFKRATKVLGAVSDEVEKNNNSCSYEYCSEVMKLLTDIDQALTRFENLTDNPKALKSLYGEKVKS